MRDHRVSFFFAENAWLIMEVIYDETYENKSMVIGELEGLYDLHIGYVIFGAHGCINEHKWLLKD